MYRICYTKEAKDQIAKFDNNLKSRLKKAIERIAQEPSLGKRLTHEISGLQSYRAGDYRIIYRIFHKEILILILAIGHRRDIYKRLDRSY